MPEYSIQLFAGVRESLGRSSLKVTWSDPNQEPRVGDLLQAILDREPELASWVQMSRLAVDDQFVDHNVEVGPQARLALIPPVSGGSVENIDKNRIRIGPEPIDHVMLTNQVRTHAAGAVCTFLGTVREMTAGIQTDHLVYEAYEPMARRQLERIVGDSHQRWPILGWALAHRLGKLELGEISVAIAISTAHRRDAFEACAWIMDRIKQDVPIWKQEIWADGTTEWVHPGAN